MEGIIETFNTGAQEMFGYTQEEAVGKLRVSAFSPGEIVLQNLKGWLATAVTQGEWIGETNFVRKDGEVFGARIRITPTSREGKQIGFCGVTEELEHPVEIQIKGSTKAIKWLVITRAPFLTAALTPAIIGLVWASVIGGYSMRWIEGIAATLGVLLLQIVANVYNDYFDVKSGTDAANTKYFVQYSGGSRAIEMGLIDLKGTRNVATVFAAIALTIGLVLTYTVGTGVLVIGLTGLALGFFYTAPPIRLVARHGLGELTIGLAFGPLITMGIAYVVTGEYLWGAFLAGIPAGLLTANILLINQFPDAEGDAVTGKNHLVVTFGPRISAWIYTVIWASALTSISCLAFEWQKPLMHIATLAGLLYGIVTIRWMFEHLTDRQLVKANVNTINLQIVVTLLMTLFMAL